MDRLVVSATFIECCGDVLSAVAADLAREAPDPLTLASALYALANAADGALTLIRAAAEAEMPGGFVDVGAAGLGVLRRAEDAIEQISLLVAFLPGEDVQP